MIKDGTTSTDLDKGDFGFFVGLGDVSGTGSGTDGEFTTGDWIIINGAAAPWSEELEASITAAGLILLPFSMECIVTWDQNDSFHKLARGKGVTRGTTHILTFEKTSLLEVPTPEKIGVTPGDPIVDETGEIG